MSKNYTLNTQRIHSQFVLHNMYELRESDVLCDIELVVSGKKIRCHKLVLAAESPFFKSMFTTAMKERDQDVIELNDVTHETLEAIVNYFYTARIQLTEENISDVVRAVDVFQVSTLRPVCTQFLLKAINLSCCLSIRCLATQHRYYDVADEARAFALKNFSDICQEDDFKEASYETVSDIFSSDVLDFTDEDMFINVILDWIEFDTLGRSCNLFKLLEYVIAEDISDWDSIESRTKILYKFYNLEQKYQLYKWINVHRKMAADCEHSTHTQYHMREREIDFNTVCLAVGGISSMSDTSSVEVYHHSTGWRWTFPSSDRIVPRMRVPRSYHAAATCNDFLYVMGGRSDGHALSSVECYHGQKNRWTDLPCLPLNLAGAAATCLDHSLYVCGGESSTGTVTDRLWVLDTNDSNSGRSKGWIEGPCMLHSRAFHSLVNVHGVLYTIGGIGHDQQPMNNVECLLPGQDVWMEVSPLLTPRSHFACAVVDLNIIVGGGKRNKEFLSVAEMFDTQVNGSWQEMTDMVESRSSCAATVYENRVILAGGENSAHVTETVLKLNPSTNQWHQIGLMKFARHGLALVTLKLY